MALCRIEPDAVARLTAQPESGLGYQVIRYRGRGLIVFNAAVAIEIEELRSRQFTDEDYTILSGNPDSETDRGYDRLDLVDDYTVTFSMFDRSVRAETFGLSFYRDCG